MILKLIKFFEDIKSILILQIKNFPDMYLAKYDFLEAKYLITDESCKKCNSSNKNVIKYVKIRKNNRVKLRRYLGKEISPHYQATFKIYNQNP
tara:strand:- start:35 stop:313 length:279 start_codon:yes stop_codon:yes gene_type:complete